MAKTSAIQKNLKRIKLVKKYANKRAALKKIIKNQNILRILEKIELFLYHDSSKIVALTDSFISLPLPGSSAFLVPLL